jgi:hypothetical protein
MATTKSELDTKVLTCTKDRSLQVAHMTLALEAMKVDVDKTQRIHDLKLCAWCHYVIQYTSVKFDSACTFCHTVVPGPAIVCMTCAGLEHICRWCISDLFGEENRKTHYYIIQKADKLIKDGPPVAVIPTTNTKINTDLDIDFNEW